MVAELMTRNHKNMLKSDSDIIKKSEYHQFTVNHFTQNLSSVLSDPNRSRAEIAAFFTRHWGEQFLPRTHVAASPELPRITIEHFRQYLATTAKKHRHYLKVRRALRSASLTRESERTSVDLDEIPAIFLAPDFSLQVARTFDLILLEPLSNERDALISEAELRRARQQTTKPLSATRPDSSASLTSVASLQNQAPIEATNGRYFRPYRTLHNRLEYFHDTLGILLNCQLENKSEEFWRTVNSYGVLHGELEAAIRDAETARERLRHTNEEIYVKSEKLIRLHWARENRRRLLRKLEDIACLRDAQLTVQMLLNQNNFPKALECIETAHEVLDSDLKGVTCFRHLSSQLDEMHDAIAKMLHEEFIALVQREFGKPIERESDAGYQETQLQSILLGLIRCRDFRFLQVLQTEIVEASKNTVRQIILGRFVECDLQLAGFDPSLGIQGSKSIRNLSVSEFRNLGEQIMKMTLAQWLETLSAVFSGLYFLCCRVMSIQELILESLSLVESLDARSRRHLANRSRTNAVAEENYVDDRPISAASALAVGCSDFGRLRTAASRLLEHAANCAEDSVGRIILPKGSSKDNFLSKCSPETFHQVCKMANEFVRKCRLVSVRLNITEQPPRVDDMNSPLSTLLQNQATSYIANFHDEKREKLKQILDAERWQPIEFPPVFQRIVNEFERTGVLRNERKEPDERGGLQCTVPPSADSAPSQHAYILLNGEKFVVAGTALLLIRMLADYCGLLELFPQRVTELSMHVVEILKHFNSRTCQLILGAGALRVVGLKTISVRNLSLSCRSLQLIARFVPAIRAEFETKLPSDRKNMLRHFDQVLKDYNDHIEEITKRLLTLMDNHIIGALTEWKVEDKTPTPCFQLIVKQIGKFFSGYSAVMPPDQSLMMLLKIHENFKLYLKQHLQARGITPHDSLTYGLASQDFSYYVENMSVFPECQTFPNDSLSDVLQHTPSKNVK